jgi:D-xylose 1-dehydrogenase (NADP+, D-xylono-1,5-lactone-forming)
MGGGSIYDVGCYPIHAARHLLEKEPEAVTVHAFFSAEHDGVDMMASGLVEFPDQIGVTFQCGMWADFQNTLQILGTKGRIDIPSAFVYDSPESAHFSVTVNGKKREVRVPDVNQYVLQVDAFGQHILNGLPSPFQPEDAVYNMRVIDACLLSAKENSRVPLEG